MLEKIFDFLQIQVTLLGFSQQFEAQHSLPEKVYYVVTRYWRSIMWKKRAKTDPTMQSFADFTDDKLVVIGLSDNTANRARSVYL